MPEKYRTPALAPTPTASPSPSIEGLLQAIEAPESYECRTLNEGERRVMRNVALVSDGAARAVDAGEGWSVIVYRRDDGVRDSIVTNGERFNWIGNIGWNGHFQPAGVRLKGGPDAHRAALECLTR